MNTTPIKHEEPPHLLAIIDGHPEASRILRAAKRKAKEIQSSWEVIVLEYSDSEYDGEEESQEQLLQTLALAQQMNAPITKVPANNAAQKIAEIATAKKAEGFRIESIFLGDRKDRTWLSRLNMSLPKKLRSKIDHNTKIIKVSLGIKTIHRRRLAKLFRINFKEIFFSLTAVCLATIVIDILYYIWPEFMGVHKSNKFIIYMVACAFSAGRYGLISGIVASIASSLTLSLSYEPSFSIIISDQNDIMNLALFLTAAIVISVSGSKEYSVRKAIAKRAERLQSLLRVHRVTLNKKSPSEAIHTLDTEISRLIGTDIAFFLTSTMNPNVLEALFHKDIVLSEADRKALQICWEESKATGAGSIDYPGCLWRFEPLITSQNEIGVLGANIKGSFNFDSSFGRLLSDIAGQAALILERLELGIIAEETRMQAEREKLRSMLLSSVSHDLKTPLASVIGSLSVFQSMGGKLTEEHKLELIDTALEEAQRLDSFITNILDMTRLESGQIELKEEWINPKELLASLTKRLRDRLSKYQFAILENKTDVEVCVDAMMTGQVLQNVLDNAVKYTKVGTKIEVSWDMNNEGFYFQIRDYGSGVPEDQLEKIFDKYARINKKDNKVAGTGLGLAISKAVMKAQNGKIYAKNHPDGGAIFTICLPHWRPSNKSYNFTKAA
ncbi:MAG: osmosensitive channel His kinase sensor [Rickettsiaceae bacterium]|jgi:two-component system sensor histidine kinase KdpD|nr:osmosensitive channel His kinase sensor [Rickettsiaceae bacterium]